MTSEIRVNKLQNRVGLGTVEYTNTGIVVSGIVTCTELSGLTALNIAGVGTANTLDINGDIDVDGHTNLDNVSIAGVVTATTFKSSSVDIDGGSIDNTNIGFNTRAHGLFNNVETSGYVRSTGHIKVADHIEHDGDSNTMMKFPSNDTISFETAGSERLRITSDGTVNIGGDYTNTSGTFKVSGNVSVASGDITFLNNNHKIANTSSGGNVSIQGGATYAGGRIVLSGGYGAGGGTGDIRFYADSTTTPVERVRINSSGNVGIGTDNPQCLLDLSKDISGGVNYVDIRNHHATGGAALRVKTQGTYGSPTYQAILGASDAGGTIRVGAVSNHPLLLLTNNTERVRIRTDGRTQITSGDFEVIAGESEHAEIRLSADQGDDGADYWRFQSNHSTNNLNIATYASGAWVDKVSIASDGRVLIGTNSTSNISTNSALTIKNTSNSSATRFNLVNTGSSQPESTQIYSQNNDLAFVAGASERFRISSTGQATFDKGSPGSSNQVIGRFQAESSRRLDIVWHDSGSLMGFDTPSSHAYIFKIGGSEKLRLESDGDLKHLTSTPSAFTSTSPSQLRYFGKKCIQGTVTSTVTLTGSGTGVFDLGKLWLTDDSSTELFIQVMRNDAATYNTHYAKAFIQKVRGTGMSQGHVLYQNGAHSGFSISSIQAGGYTGSGGSSHGTEIHVTGGHGGVIYRMVCFYTTISKNDMY